MIPNVASRELIESRSIPEPNTGCWLWTGAHSNNKSGLRYGSVKIRGATRRASRVSYEVFVGTIPNGLNVLHRCDTPACVNPRHLFLGTLTENILDMDAKGRRGKSCGESHHNAVLADETVAQLRRMGMGAAASMSAQLGVSRESIVRAVAGRSYGHLAEPGRPMRRLRHVDAGVVAAIRDERALGATLKQLSSRHGVSMSHVCRIVRNQTRLTDKATKLAGCP